MDDSPVIRSVMCLNLRAIGLSNFQEAKDGASAWEMLGEAHELNVPFQLILCDQNMPKMQGRDLLKKVRSEEKFKNTPFILVTSVADKQSVMDAINEGVTDYITKPVTAKRLADKVIALLSK